MMRSLSSAVAGLRTHQTKMDVIGNNIANVNTYGYKANRATFADIYYQNLSRGSGPVTTVGGTNPTQIGYGAAVATIDVVNIDSPAGASSTDRAMDVYITGEGFLVTQDSMGNYLYTRLGNLGFDAAGNLVDGNGQFVMGFPQNADGTPQITADGTILGDQLQTIKVSTDLLDQLTGISIGTGGEIIGLLPGNTRVTLSSSVPEWMDLPTIPQDSNLQGPVRMVVGALPSLDDMNAGLQARGGSANILTDVEFGADYSIAANSNVEIQTSAQGRMTMKVDVISNTGVPSTITAEGVLENGKIVLNYEGKHLMTLTVAEGAQFPNTTDDTQPQTVQEQLYYETAGGDPMLDPSGRRIPVYLPHGAGNLTALTPGPDGRAQYAPQEDDPLTVAVGDMVDAVYRDTDGNPILGIDGQPIRKYLGGPATVADTTPADGKADPSTTPVTVQVPDPIIVDSGNLQYQVSTQDKGGNIRMSGEPDNAGPQQLPPVNANNQYEIQVGDATFFFDASVPGMDNPLTTNIIESEGLFNFNGEFSKIGTSDSQKINIGCIVIAKFANASGMEQVGNTQYMVTDNTGEVTYNKPNTNGVGGLKANYLEMSNVDISKEFTDMITTQRGFQANTRIVTVSDEMLNELVNLKR